MAKTIWRNFGHSFGQLPITIPNGQKHSLHNILVIGSGKQTDVAPEFAEFIADALGPHHSFFAGTPKGNLGAVLDASVGVLMRRKSDFINPATDGVRSVNLLLGHPYFLLKKKKMTCADKW